jgi:hypothetical protein
VGLVDSVQPGVIDDVRGQDLDVIGGKQPELLTKPGG